MPDRQEYKEKTDKEILGYSRYVVAVAAFFAMFVISPFEYTWSSMSGKIGSIYGWSHEQVAMMFTLFIICQSIGMLPGGILRDRFGPRWTTAIAGVFSGLGIFSIAMGPSYGFVIVLWCVGSFFTGFIYNNAVTTGNKWFCDHRGVMTGLIAGAFSWGSLPFIFSIRSIPHSASNSTFFNVIYVMAAVIAGVSIVAALFMKDPPKGWAPKGWVPKTTANVRPTDHEYTVSQSLMTWQMWVLIASFILISGAGLAGMSKIVAYSNSFGFTATAATAAAGGISIANGFGKFILGSASERWGRENTMVLSYVLCGLLLLATVVAGNVGSEPLFVVAAILGIFFWASLFSLFPIIIGHYYGNSGAGGNYGVLYAIAKGTGGLYGGIISAVLIHHHGFSYGMTVAGIMAIIAGLVILPLKYFPPVWRHQDSGSLKRGDDGAEKRTGSGLSPQSAKTLPTSPAA
ncbi:MAG: MFS transporter [Rhizobiaceae bacterium]|nr:MAG: MFS transporter [Rhizobiaceae bacterium]